jgi:hypothetical protein
MAALELNSLIWIDFRDIELFNSRIFRKRVCSSPAFSGLCVKHWLCRAQAGGA